jgi:hypothetical protein
MKTLLSALALALFSAASHAQSAFWFEAECAQVGSLWNRTNDSNASNSQHVTIQPGTESTAGAPASTAGHVVFPVNVSTAGTYRLFARMSGPTANDDSFWVRIDNGAWTMWNNWWNANWIWVQFPSTFNLSAGGHTVTFAYREDGTRLDKINLTTATTAPTGTGQAASNCGATTTLSVSPASLSMAAGGGSGTIGVSSNTSWTASSSQGWLTLNTASGTGNGSLMATAAANMAAAARSATVTVSASGANAQTVSVTQAGTGGGTACTVPPLPSFGSLPNNSFFPDPFLFMNGTRMTTRAEWSCRRAEIAALAQEFEYGAKPNTASSAVTGARSGNNIVVTVNDNGRTLSFNAAVTYPSTGSAPYPAVIGIGGSNLNNSALSSLGVAIISFPNNEIAQQNGQGSRGVGKFYDLYGNGHSAGALMAWSWGVSRLIDAIEKTPAANIDAARLGVTGCSRNGKGALAAGAFDERVKLTIPQEPGSGGSGSWRVSNWMLSQGQNTQTLQQIVGENVWFRQNFSQFGGAVNRLPFDHHSVAGLVAPRALYVIDNNILWLGPQSSWSNANAARTIWTALGVQDRMGYSLTTEHGHCSFPASQQTELTAFVQKFLIGGGTGNTSIMRNDPGVPFNQSQWVNWTTPTLQ